MRRHITVLDRPRPAPGLLIEEMGDEVVAFIPASARTVVLNAVGGAVLECCDGTRTADQIAAAIVAVLPADLEQVTAEVVRSLEDYAALGLVVAGSAQPEG